jgi:hypothetical protein
MDALRYFHESETTVSVADLKAMGGEHFIKAMEHQKVPNPLLEKIRDALSNPRATGLGMSPDEARQFWNGTGDVVRWLHNA